MSEVINPRFTAGLFSRLDRPVAWGKPLPGAVPAFLARRPLLRGAPPASHSPGMGKVLGIHPWVLLPFFFAVLLAMNLGAFMASRFLFSPAEGPGARIPEILESPEAGPAESPVLFEGLSSAFLREPEVQSDFVMDCYRNPETRAWATGFFERVCGSLKIAQAILEGAERYSISPSLAFALSWEESRFNFRAVSKKNRNDSVDRGLFQLNSMSFPKLGDAEFFDPRQNAFYGMAHLRVCLDIGGSEIAGLAMYNAGTGRVHTGGTPRQTLDYAARVLAARRKIDKTFLEEWARSQNPPPSGGRLPAEPAEIAAVPETPVPAPEAGANGFPLIPLCPLSYR